jgi:hypothetical protein
LDFRALDFRALDFRALDFRALDIRALDIRALSRPPEQHSAFGRARAQRAMPLRPKEEQMRLIRRPYFTRGCAGQIPLSPSAILTSP